MFLSKLFGKKGYREYEAKGDTYLRQERYADARIEYESALERLGVEANADDPDALSRIGEKMQETGLALARLNIDEARTAFAAGNDERGNEFLELAARFSQHPEIRRQIAEIMKSSPSRPSGSASGTGRGGVSTGGKGGVEPVDSSNDTHPLPDDDIRYELYVSPLPGDLPERYRAKGKDFAEACLLAHDGRRREAFPRFERLYRDEPCDIVLYEMALITAQEGDPAATERLLSNAVSIRPDNPLALLSLVQLYMAQKRFVEARELLDGMRERGVLGNQVLLLLGDNAQALGNMTEAESFYLQALNDKALATAAAERLVPIMEATGRHRERDFLVKKHCGKGCC
jgi:pentatricopeptide repeat protein